MNKFRIYLAGKMTGLTLEQMNSWREKVTEEFNKRTDKIQTLNPCHFYNFELDPTTYTEHECKEFDLWLVKNCNLVLFNLDYSNSIGSAIELELASRVWNIPVIGFGKEKNHPWIELSLTKRCDDMEEAIDHIMNYYLVNF